MLALPGTQAFRAWDGVRGAVCAQPQSWERVLSGPSSASGAPHCEVSLAAEPWPALSLGAADTVQCDFCPSQQVPPSSSQPGFS